MSGTCRYRKAAIDLTRPPTHERRADSPRRTGNPGRAGGPLRPRVFHTVVDATECAVLAGRVVPARRAEFPRRTTLVVPP